MSILVGKDTRVIVQGMTGRFGHYFAKVMLDYGTSIEAGVTPGKGGEWFLGKPIFDTMGRAVEATGATVSLVAVPPPNASDAIFEAIDAGIRTIICVTERMPQRDILRAIQYARMKNVRLLGPASSGLCVPNEILIGMIPPYAVMPGNIGVVSRSASLLNHVAMMLTKLRLGQSTLVNLGSDALTGTTLKEVLELFENDIKTERIVVLGQIGGREEIDTKEYIRDEMTKPIVAMITGLQLPSSQRFGHSGAIISGMGTSAEEKIAELTEVGVRIAYLPEQLPELLTHRD